MSTKSISFGCYSLFLLLISSSPGLGKTWRDFIIIITNKIYMYRKKSEIKEKTEHEEIYWWAATRRVCTGLCFGHTGDIGSLNGQWCLPFRKIQYHVHIWCATRMEQKRVAFNAREYLIRVISRERKKTRCLFNSYSMPAIISCFFFFRKNFRAILFQSALGHTWALLLVEWHAGREFASRMPSFSLVLIVYLIFVYVQIQFPSDEVSLLE